MTYIDVTEMRSIYVPCEERAERGLDKNMVGVMLNKHMDTNMKGEHFETKWNEKQIEN